MRSLTYRFADHLDRFGPEAVSQSPPVTPAEATAYCQSFARNHQENFSVLSHAVPRQLRDHVAHVYAYCRWADDLGDEVGDPERSLALLRWWEEEVDRMFAGEPRHPVMIALARTVKTFGIPKTPFVDLISAFRQDQSVHRYPSMEDVLDYCTRSAQPVGRLVLYLLERHSPERVRWSDSICTGLQLANFCQDVAVDFHEKGRIYLPMVDLDRFGVTEEDLRARRAHEGFLRLIESHVAIAEDYLQAGRPLVRTMPGRSAMMTSLFIEGGLGILRRIRNVGYNVLIQRPRLSRWDRMAIAGRSAWNAIVPSRAP